MPVKRRVVFGMIGHQRDGGHDKKRHDRFRPTPSVVRHPDWPVDHIVHITTGSSCTSWSRRGSKTPEIVSTGAPAVTDLQHAQYARVVSRLLDVRREHQVVLTNGIGTKNRAFNELIARVDFVCLRDRAPILLMGPTGAGKTALARRIHQLLFAQEKVTGKFVIVNCSTLTGDTAKVRPVQPRAGAFTGADRSARSHVGEADGGVLFLSLGPVNGLPIEGHSMMDDDARGELILTGGRALLARTLDREHAFLDRPARRPSVVGGRRSGSGSTGGGSRLRLGRRAGVLWAGGRHRWRAAERSDSRTNVVDGIDGLARRA
jgi:energy-coupling factor transporter ATP-binding protein EcfA2